MGKEIIVYYPNWKMNEKNGKVSDIPWDRVTFINHAFFRVAPVLNEGEKEESTMDRKKAGLPPRKDFKLASIRPSEDEAIFKEYEEYHRRYPNVKIMISVGGWSACGFFSEMAFTKEGRSGFIASCIDLCKKNTWIAGIDIDWEYPGGGLSGERLPAGPWEEGCPFFGTKEDDKVNFSKLVCEMKEAFSNTFNEKKYVTACAAGFKEALMNQDWKSASEGLDYINIMSYDLCGAWMGKTGHASGVSGTKKALDYFLEIGIMPDKINLGVAFYGTAFSMKSADNLDKPVGSPLSDKASYPPEKLTIPFLKEFIKKPEWVKGYDEDGGGAYLVNNNPDSEDYLVFISYEDENSIKGKARLVKENELAGIIAWETTQDTIDHELTNILFENLL